MKFRYKLPQNWVTRLLELEEFANGATQVTIELRDGRIFKEVLISNSMYIVAARGFKDLPFAIDNIKSIYQTDEDKNPKERGGWDFWDKWAIS